MSFPFSGKEKDLVLRNFIVMKANTQGTIKKTSFNAKMYFDDIKRHFYIKTCFFNTKGLLATVKPSPTNHLPIVILVQLSKWVDGLI
jgi:hypothetical protein